MAQAGLVLDGRYRLLEPLGRGGMGEVWRAHHERLDRDVAVKVLADLGETDPKYAKLFRSEAKAAARLQHPGITVVHDFGVEQELLFLVMELLPGESLAAVLRRHPEGAAVSEVCGWGGQVAEALAAAHEAGVVHRDIKPANLMLLPGGQVKVCDFGIARLQDATASFTAAGMGTAAYMAPEQITDGAVDGRTDIYALGCTLYHLLTGRAPFEATNPWAVARKHLDEEPERVRALRPDVPEAVEDLLGRMLAKDPDDRPQHAAEIAAVLAEAAGRPGTPPGGAASSTTPRAGSGGPSGAAPTAAATTAAAAGPGTGERVMMLITGGLLIIGLWTLVAVAFADALGDSSWGARLSLYLVPFVIAGAMLPLLFLHRDPQAGAGRRITGLAVAGGSAVVAFVASLVWVLGAYDSDLWWSVYEFVPALLVLALVGPGLALVETGPLAPLGGPSGRAVPAWLRGVAVLALIALLVLAAGGMWMWVER